MLFARILPIEIQASWMWFIGTERTTYYLIVLLSKKFKPMLALGALFIATIVMAVGTIAA